MIKLPRTLHIESSRMEAGHSDPEAISFNKLVGQFLVIEEKVDGTGVSIFFDDNFDLQVWHRGTPVISQEFDKLLQWTKIWQDELFSILENKYILFGEWMYKKHSIYYDQLPDFFLESDIYDKQKQIWLSTLERSNLLESASFIHSVPVIAAFKPSTLVQITSLIGKPLYQSENWRNNLLINCARRNNIDGLFMTEQSSLMEGLYIKHEDENKIINRYKYVRYEFVQHIIKSNIHIRDQILITNQLKEVL